MLAALNSNGLHMRTLHTISAGHTESCQEARAQCMQTYFPQLWQTVHLQQLTHSHQLSMIAADNLETVQTSPPPGHQQAE